MVIRKPKPLPRNGTIGIVAPASPQRDSQRLVRGVQYLERCGYRVELGSNINKRFGGYLAGTDEQRASDINAMFANPHIDAIFCSRGGYGSARILDLIDFSVIRRNPKIFVGFSDITALQLAMFKKTGLVTFSGALPSVDMADSFNTFSEEWFWRALTSVAPLGALPTTTCNVVQKGRTQGPLIGGNLAVLTSMIGTSFFPKLDGHVLVLEDIGEETYRIDRMFAQLRHAKHLEKISALITGSWSQPSESRGVTPKRNVNEVVREYAAFVNGPVLTGLPYGHTAKKLTLPFGVGAAVSTKSGSIKILEGACQR